MGGGQEINTGEAGISEWLDAIHNRFEKWDIYISPNLTDSEYSAVNAIRKLEEKSNVVFNEDLHLSVSMRSFRAENLSLFVKNLLDLDTEQARKTLANISDNYPIVLNEGFNRCEKMVKGKGKRK